MIIEPERPAITTGDVVSIVLIFVTIVALAWVMEAVRVLWALRQ